MAPAIANGQYDYTVAASVPVTKSKHIPRDLDKEIQNPGVARATRAVSKESPEGTQSYQNDTRTVLQQHVDYWDFDKDGIIFPIDTYNGFHRIGFNPILSFIAIFVIHGTFSYWSLDSWIPDPRFPIYTKNIHRTRHGSDTHIFDSEGRFIPQKFEELFTKYDHDNKGGLSLWELVEMGRSNRKIMDPVGWSAFAFEWGATYYILANSKGFVDKENVRACYDGSIFYKLDEQNALGNANKATQIANQDKKIKGF